MNLLGGGGGGNLNSLFAVSFVGSLVCEILWRHKKKKNNQSESAEAVSPTGAGLIVLCYLFKALSLLLRTRCPPSFPHIIAINFMSEIPMLLLFVLICTGWPSVNKPLLQKSNLVALGVFFMELILVPYLVTVVFPDDRYNPNQYFESFNLFKFVLLFQALKSSTVYLKEKGIATNGQTSINVYHNNLFRSMVLYYPLYLAFRAILAYFFFNSSYSLYLNEMLSFVFFIVNADKFIPESFLDDPAKTLAASKNSFSELLQAHPLLFKSATT